MLPVWQLAGIAPEAAVAGHLPVLIGAAAATLWARRGRDPAPPPPDGRDRRDALARRGPGRRAVPRPLRRRRLRALVAGPVFDRAVALLRAPEAPPRRRLAALALSLPCAASSGFSSPGCRSCWRATARRSRPSTPPGALQRPPGDRRPRRPAAGNRPRRDRSRAEPAPAQPPFRRGGALPPGAAGLAAAIAAFPGREGPGERGRAGGGGLHRGLRASREARRGAQRRGPSRARRDHPARAGADPGAGHAVPGLAPLFRACERLNRDRACRRALRPRPPPRGPGRRALAVARGEEPGGIEEVWIALFGPPDLGPVDVASLRRVRPGATRWPARPISARSPRPMRCRRTFPVPGARLREIVRAVAERQPRTALVFTDRWGEQDRYVARTACCAAPTRSSPRSSAAGRAVPASRSTSAARPAAPSRRRAASG